MANPAMATEERRLPYEPHYFEMVSGIANEKQINKAIRDAYDELVELYNVSFSPDVDITVVRNREGKYTGITHLWFTSPEFGNALAGLDFDGEPLYKRLYDTGRVLRPAEYFVAKTLLDRLYQTNDKRQLEDVIRKTCKLTGKSIPIEYVNNKVSWGTIEDCMDVLKEFMYNCHATGPLVRLKDYRYNVRQPLMNILANKEPMELGKLIVRKKMIRYPPEGVYDNILISQKPVTTPGLEDFFRSVYGKYTRKPEYPIVRYTRTNHIEVVFDPDTYYASYALYMHMFIVISKEETIPMNYKSLPNLRSCRPTPSPKGQPSITVVT